MNPVAIIGGGITGLTAAFRLRQRNIPITLYEARPRVGGPIRTVREGGYLAECGPNTILETSPVISELVRDLGLENRRLYSNPLASNRYIARDGRPVPLPASAGKFLFTPLFSAAAKARLAFEPFVRRSPAFQEESVAEFVMRRLGREFLDYAINPLVAGVYAGDPARLSVKHAFPKLHALEQRYGSLIAGQIFGARERKRQPGASKANAPKFSFDQGLEVLICALGQQLTHSLHLEQRISGLRRATSGWAIASEGPGGVMAREHSAVIIAIPAFDLARLNIDGIPRLELLTSIEYPAVASVVLGFRREDVKHPLNGFGVLVPEAEDHKILGAIFSSSLFPGRAPKDHVTLTACLGGCRAPQLAFASEDKLIEYALGDLQKLLGISGEPTYRHCFVVRKAIPQYNLGYGRFKELMAQVEAAAPGIFIGGNSRCGISIGDSISSGFQLAGKAQQYLTNRASTPTSNSTTEEFKHARTH